MVIPALVLGSGFLAGKLGTRAARDHAMATGLMDVPNARSAHTCPTPRGGGISIAATAVVGVVCAWIAGFLSFRYAAALGGGAAFVALVGWRDDRSGLRAHTRAVAHLIAAGWAVWWLGGYESMTFGTQTIVLGPAGSALAVVGIAWGISFFNFMDGIDGMAASGATIVGFVGGMLFWSRGQYGLGVVALLLASSSAGFLRWNWHPASVFMGDVGSTTLGFLCCTLAVISERVDAAPVFTWGTLLGLFIFDPTVTVIRRAWYGTPIFMPHREFAFHRAARMGWTHRQVTGGAIVIMLALTALAVWGWLQPQWMLFSVLAGAALLVGVYLWVERRLPMCRNPERRHLPEPRSRRKIPQTPTQQSSPSGHVR